MSLRCKIERRNMQLGPILKLMAGAQMNTQCPLSIQTPLLRSFCARLGWGGACFSMGWTPSGNHTALSNTSKIVHSSILVC